MDRWRRWWRRGRARRRAGRLNRGLLPDDPLAQILNDRLQMPSRQQDRVAVAKRLHLGPQILGSLKGSPDDPGVILANIRELVSICVGT